jgi:predicted phage tail protein
MFNNTNVKDGIFTYSTGSVDGNYSVAKVLYKDRYNKFEDEVEVVEDSELIKEYGIVSKEILGFGVTSRDQARRMGLWLLATNRFENNAITFSTDMQGIILKPGDVIQIEDSFKSDYLLQGRVVSVDRSNKYIVVDRKIDVRFAGSKIKFLCDKTYDSYKDISNSDQFDNQEREDVIELYIERIENDTNKIYIKEQLDSNGNIDVEAFSNFYKISGSSPFIIQSDIVYSSIDKEDESQESDSLDNKNLYKIVSIAEQDVNEYSIFAIKYDRNKYLSLDNNIIDVRSGVSKNTINYSSSENITEVDLTGMQGSYYSLDRKSITQIGQLDFDYSFSESESALQDDSSDNYAVLTLKFDTIKNYIDTQASLNNKYYVKVDQILSSGGGFICKIISKNQSIRFKVPITNAEQKTIFLGKFPEEVSNVVSSASSIKIYIYDVENKIIEV